MVDRPATALEKTASSEHSLQLFDDAYALFFPPPKARINAEECPGEDGPEQPRNKDASRPIEQGDVQAAFQKLPDEQKASLKLKLFELSLATGGKERQSLEKDIKKILPVDHPAKLDLPALPAELLHKLAKEELVKIAEEKLPSGRALDGFKKNLDRFEKRAGSGAIDQLEAAKTLAEIARLLRAPEGEALSPEQMKLSARQLMFMVANPMAVEQGRHKTCNVSALQVRTLALYPSDVVRLVADVGITGKFKTHDGTIITPDKESLKPDAEAQLYPTPDGLRFLASQVFQVTAINAYWNTRTRLSVLFEPPKNLDESVKKELKAEMAAGQLKYTQEQNSLDKTVERLMFKSKQGWVEIADSPHLGHDEIASISKQITGRSEPVLMAHDDAGYAGNQGVLNIHNLKTFVYQLNRLKEGADFFFDLKQVKGKFPIVVVVNVANEPFNKDIRVRPDDGDNNWHVVTIMGYEPDEKDPGKGLLVVDNTWSRSLDHSGEEGAKPKITVEQLFDAMQKPKK